MPYRAEISRAHPTCLLFVVDQSRSMRDTIEGGHSKAAFLADVINRTLYTLVTACTKADGVRDYFSVGVVAYSNGARNGFEGKLGNEILQPVSTIAEHPVRIEDRVRRVVGEDDRPQEQRVRFPVWFEPRAQGWTHMCAGLTAAAEAIERWCATHGSGYPPTVIHVTDGHPTDGDPEVPAARIRRCQTEDGASLLFNLHVDVGRGTPILFPHTAVGLPDPYAERLFRMSSPLPPHALAAAQVKGLRVAPGASGFVFNASIDSIVDFFDMGTRPTGFANR